MSHLPTYAVDELNVEHIVLGPMCDVEFESPEDILVHAHNSWFDAMGMYRPRTRAARPAPQPDEESDIPF